MTILGPFGYIGGLNKRASALTIGQDQMSDAQNVQVIYGDLYKRGGSSALNSVAFASAAAVHGLADWQTAAGQRYSIITAGTKIGQMADLGGTYTDITGSVTITSGQNNQSTFASLNNILVRCGGTTPDAPIKWSGTGNAAALGGSPPSGSLCVTANNFMFISGVAALPSRVYWSNVVDAETWTSTNFADFRASDGDRVTALAEYNQNLIIFKRRSIGQLFTTSTSVSGSATLAPLNQIPASIGCVGSQCVDHLPDGRLVFLGTDGHVYIFDGTASIQDISDAPPPTSNIQPIFDALPAGRLPFASVRVYPSKNQIWISVSTGSSSTNSTIYVYDYKLGCWMGSFTNIAANVMTTSIDTRTVPMHPIVILTGNYAGVTYEQDRGTTNAEVATGYIDAYATVSVLFDSTAANFIPRSAVIFFDTSPSGNVDFNYGFNDFTSVNKTMSYSQQAAGGKLDQFVLDVSVLGGAAITRKVVPLQSNARAYSMQANFRNKLSDSLAVHPLYISDAIEV